MLLTSLTPLQDYVAALTRQIKPEQLAAAKAKLVILGCGDWGLIKGYAEMLKTPFPIYSDPSKRIYNALGMTYVVHSLDSRADRLGTARLSADPSPATSRRRSWVRSSGRSRTSTRCADTIRLSEPAVGLQERRRHQAVRRRDGFRVLWQRVVPQNADNQRPRTGR